MYVGHTTPHHNHNHNHNHNNNHHDHDHDILPWPHQNYTIPYHDHTTTTSHLALSHNFSLVQGGMGGTMSHHSSSNKASPSAAPTVANEDAPAGWVGEVARSKPARGRVQTVVAPRSSDAVVMDLCFFVGAANVRELAYPRDRAGGGEWSSKRRGCFSSFSLARRSAEEDLDRDPGPSRCDLLEYAVEASGAGWGDWVVHMGADSVLNQRAVDAIAFHAARERSSVISGSL